MVVSTRFVATITAVLGLTAYAAAQSAPCPFNYPPNLNSTESRSGLVFTIISNNPVTNNRAVQLRPDSAPPVLGAVDAGSPVLLANLRGGVLYSQARDAVNQLHDLGPTAFLREHDNGTADSNTTTRYEFVFADPAAQPGGTADAAWTLGPGSSDGTYSLFHTVELGLSSGFMLCEAIDNQGDAGASRYYQLLYYTDTEGGPADFAGCESVGVRTTVAAIIENGVCDIGGFVAS